MVDVLAAALAGEQVDDRRRRDAHRDERDLAAPPLLEAHRLQAEQVAPPGDGLLGVGDVEHDVVDAGDAHGRDATTTASCDPGRPAAVQDGSARSLAARAVAKPVTRSTQRSQICGG